MSETEMLEIFKYNIPVEGLALDSGIYEFYEEGNKSIGISYETIEDYTGYIFNLFVDGDYINISGEYVSIYDAIELVTKKWNQY